MAIRTSRPIKAEGVCAGRTCQWFINKVNHRLRPHQSQLKKGREEEESLGHLTWAPLQRSTVIKGTSTLEFTFPIKGPPTTVGAEIFIRRTSGGMGRRLEVMVQLLSVKIH